MSQPWMKFYPRDWRGDQALRAVSIAARGLWMECLCIMHEASPYGHLVLNGAPVEAATLARMTGTTEEEVTALLGELSRAGVSSVTRGRVVFSRRMVADFSRANKGRKAVEKRYAQNTDIIEEIGGPNRSPSYSPNTQSPESHIPDTSLRSVTTPAKPAEPDGFVEFYAAFPRKTARPAAVKAFAKALKRATVPVIVQGALRYAAERALEDPAFTKHPATWLNNDCWADEPAQHRKPLGGRNGGQSSHQSFGASLSRVVDERSGGGGLFGGPGTQVIDASDTGNQERAVEPAQIPWRESDAA